MSLAALSLALALATGAYAPQRAGSEPLSPELEARVQVVAKQLRCAVCQGLSIADSPSSMARAQLDKVRDLIASGKSEEEVRQYFVARYGEWVLLSPPVKDHIVVWIGPALLLLAGGALILYMVKGGGGQKAPFPAPASTTSAEPPAATPRSADPYLDAVRAEIEQ